jgi:hypothetical protein
MNDTPDPTIRDVIKLLNDNHERLLHRFTTLESELRDVRAEQKGIRTYIGARAGETEMLITRSFDRLNMRLDQTEQSVEERLRKLEGGP